MTRIRTHVLIVLLSLPLAPVSTTAQQAEWDPARTLVSRQSLQDLLARFDQAAQSQAYSPELRNRARYEASLIRSRLRQGDFQVGDRIWLLVEGEQQLSDTHTVDPGRVLTLPVIGTLSLEGVLRSELESHLGREIGRFIRDPVVHARSLIRVSMFGEVARPGFYVVPTEILLTDALMLAGGPTRQAKLTDIWVERTGERIWGGEPLQKGIIEGRTLDQLNLRAGDRIHVPSQRRAKVLEIGRIALFALPPLIYAISRLD